MFDECHWINEPPAWKMSADGLDVVTGEATDFWRETHYGFTRDTGHLFAFRTIGAFTAQVRVRASYEALYDQAGLMVRIDAAHWLKAGIEISDGRAMLGSVLTLGQSDWATGPYAGHAGDIWMRITVGGGVLRLQASADGKLWPLVRLCPFPVADHYLVGPMCCTPERAGLKVLFSDFTVLPPSDRPLHDLG